MQHILNCHLSYLMVKSIRNLWMWNCYLIDINIKDIMEIFTDSINNCIENRNYILTIMNILCKHVLTNSFYYFKNVDWFWPILKMHFLSYVVFMPLFTLQEVFFVNKNFFLLYSCVCVCVCVYACIGFCNFHLRNYQKLKEKYNFEMYHHKILELKCVLESICSNCVFYKWGCWDME